MDCQRDKAYGVRLIGSFLVGALLAAFCGCRTVEMTGRRQLLLMPEASEIELGTLAFEDALAGQQPSQNQQYTEMVERVGRRVAEVAGRPDYHWEFRVVASPQKNAFCLPGGKVAVYEGILPVCQNEAGVAVVMSHEIAHALARHGGERMSQGYVADSVEAAVDKVFNKEDDERRAKILNAYGVASKYGVMLPYSRKHETEADQIGLILMARAGYDPSEAPRFWQRFGSSNGQELPEFLSTHPSDEHRTYELLKLLPEALAVYEQAPVKHGTGQTLSISRGAANNTALSAAGAHRPSSSDNPAGRLSRPPEFIADAMSSVRPAAHRSGGASAPRAASRIPSALAEDVGDEVVPAGARSRAGGRDNPLR